MLFDCSTYNVGLHLKISLLLGNLKRIQLPRKSGQLLPMAKIYDAVLQATGQVSAEQAKEHAETEFEKYRIIQDRLFQSDFDRFMDALPFEEDPKEYPNS